MITIADQFNDLLVMHATRSRKRHLTLVGPLRRCALPPAEEWLALFKSNLTLLESIAFDLREKFGPDAAQEICREFSEQVRATVRSLKASIRAQGNPCFRFNRALENGLSDQVLRSLRMIRESCPV